MSAFALALARYASPHIRRPYSRLTFSHPRVCSRCGKHLAAYQSKTNLVGLDPGMTPTNFVWPMVLNHMHKDPGTPPELLCSLCCWTTCTHANLPGRVHVTCHKISSIRQIYRPHNTWSRAQGSKFESQVYEGFLQNLMLATCQYREKELVWTMV